MLETVVKMQPARSCDLINHGPAADTRPARSYNTNIVTAAQLLRRAAAPPAAEPGLFRPKSSRSHGFRSPAHIPNTWVLIGGMLGINCLVPPPLTS